jgi:single-strand DNA-binding protein
MFNKIILAGNLTRDVEVKYTSSSLAIGNTGIAVNKKFKNKMGENKEEVLFVDLTFFGRTAEIANQYLKKGSKVLVEGKLKLDQWTDTSGQKRSKHSITVESMQMLDSKKESENLESTGYVGHGGQDYGASINPPTDTTAEITIESESDIPF